MGESTTKENVSPVSVNYNIAASEVMDPQNYNPQLRASGGSAIQNFSTVLQQIFNSDTPIRPAPLTDAEAMARTPAVSVIADSMVQNYIMGALTTIAGPLASKRSFMFFFHCCLLSRGIQFFLYIPNFIY